MRNEKDKIKAPRLRISRTALPDNDQDKRYAVIDWKAEQFLKIIQENALELIFVVKLDGTIKYANDAVKNILEYNEIELNKKSIQKIIPVRQWVSFRAALRASEEDAKEPISIDSQFITKSKRRVHFSLTIKDLRHHPLVEGFVIHAKNINLLKKQEEELRLRNLAIEAVSEALIIVSTTPLKISYANQAFFDLSGFDKLDILGKKINVFRPPYSEMLFAEPTSPKVIKKFQNCLEQKKPFRDRIYSKRKNGIIFYNRISIKPLIDIEGNASEYIVAMKEISPRKKK